MMLYVDVDVVNIRLQSAVDTLSTKFGNREGNC